MTSSQTFQSHIQELRRRFLWVILGIGISATITYVLRVRLINVLQHPLGAPLFYTSPAGSFNFVLKLSMIVGMFVALPVMIYHFLRFIEPALPITISRGFMLKVIGASFLLALAGVGFGFFCMLPLSLHFFAEYSTPAIRPLISANEYLSYVMNNLLLFAVTFQIPLIILFINWIKPIKPGKLLHYQRHVVVGAFALAVILPFTYDPISQFIVAIPIVVLYYLSVVILMVANRSKTFDEPAPVAKPVSATAQVPIPAMQPQPLINLTGSPSSARNIDGFVPPTALHIPSVSRSVAPLASSSTAQFRRPSIREAHHPRISLDGLSPI